MLFCFVPDVCAVPFLNMGILLSVMFFCFVPVVCFDDMWMDSGNKEGSGEMLTKQRCQVSFFSLDVPSVFYLFFALSILPFLLTASCLCALCTTTYM